MQIFAEQDLRDFLENRRDEAKRTFEGLDDAAVLNIEPAALVDRELERFLITRLTVRCDDASFEKVRRHIPAEEFPPGRGFTVWAGRTYPKDVMVYRVPFDGNRALLKYGDLKYSPWSMHVSIVGSDILFEIVDFSGNLEAVDQEAQGRLENLRKTAARYDGDVVAFNDSLKQEAASWVVRRQQEAQRQAAALPSLKIPLRQKPIESIPATLTVPVSKKRVVLEVAGPAPKREWVLGQDHYESILRLVHDWGVVMERHPSTYTGKDEEALRDLFLLLLAPHFDYAGGETFNKQGKTDILIRHERQNVFVAKCKVWRGKEEFKQAIDQLLSYLTWRDSKTAVIVFVRNRDIDNVRRQIEPALRTHPCLVRHSFRQEGWEDVELRLEPCSDRTAKCAVLVFHMPAQRKLT
jgi:hypothetical protein